MYLLTTEQMLFLQIPILAQERRELTFTSPGISPCAKYYHYYHLTDGLTEGNQAHGTQLLNVRARLQRHLGDTALPSSKPLHFP